jgi:hypothetical protein
VSPSFLQSQPALVLDDPLGNRILKWRLQNQNMMRPNPHPDDQLTVCFAVSVSHPRISGNEVAVASVRPTGWLLGFDVPFVFIRYFTLGSEKFPASEGIAV